MAEEGGYWLNHGQPSWLFIEGGSWVELAPLPLEYFTLNYTSLLIITIVLFSLPLLLILIIDIVIY